MVEWNVDGGGGLMGGNQGEGGGGGESGIVAEHWKAFRL